MRDDKRPAPFRVYKRGDQDWVLQRNVMFKVMFGFETAGDAIDHAYKSWPWWP